MISKFKKHGSIIVIIYDFAHKLALIPCGITCKGRDAASGIDRKLSIIRPRATTIVAP